MDPYETTSFYKTISILLTMGYLLMIWMVNFVQYGFTSGTTEVNISNYGLGILFMSYIPIVFFGAFLDGRIISVINPPYQGIEQITSLILFIIYSPRILTLLYRSFWSIPLSEDIPQNKERSGTVHLRNAFKPTPDK